MAWLQIAFYFWIAPAVVYAGLQILGFSIALVVGVFVAPLSGILEMFRK